MLKASLEKQVRVAKVLIIGVCLIGISSPVSTFAADVSTSNNNTGSESANTNIITSENYFY